jgi:hypothetical protein
MPAGVLIAAYRCGLTGAPKRRTYLPQTHRATDFQTAGEPPPTKAKNFIPTQIYHRLDINAILTRVKTLQPPANKDPTNFKVLKRGIAITNCCGFTASRRTPLLPQAHRAISLITAYCCGLIGAPKRRTYCLRLTESSTSNCQTFTDQGTFKFHSNLNIVFVQIKSKSSILTSTQLRRPTQDSSLNIKTNPTPTSTLSLPQLNPPPPHRTSTQLLQPK